MPNPWNYGILVFGLLFVAGGWLWLFLTSRRRNEAETRMQFMMWNRNTGKALIAFGATITAIGVLFAVVPAEHNGWVVWLGIGLFLVGLAAVGHYLLLAGQAYRLAMESQAQDREIHEEMAQRPDGTEP